ATILLTAYVVKTTRSILYVPLVISPIFVSLVFGQIRSALAVSLLYLALMLARGPRSLWWTVPIVLCAVFIHNLAIVIVGLAALFYFVRLKKVSFPAPVRVTVLLSGVIGAGLVLTAFRYTILTSLGDRRLSQADAGASGPAA